MSLTGCAGIPDGFVFQYQNLVGEGRLTEQDLQALRPAVKKAEEAVKVMIRSGYVPGHFSKDWRAGTGVFSPPGSSGRRQPQ